MPVYGGATGGTTTYAADTFTRADSALTLGTSSGGGAWTAQLGTWGISTNQAYCPVPAGGAGAFNVATLPAATSDGVFAATCIVPAGATVFEGGFLVRFQDLNNFVYLDLSGGGGGTSQLFVRVAGVFTALSVQAANIAVAPGATLPVQINARGGVVTASVGHVILGGSLPATLATATGCGLVVVNNVDGPGTRFTALSYQSA